MLDTINVWTPNKYLQHGASMVPFTDFDQNGNAVGVPTFHGGTMKTFGDLVAMPLEMFQTLCNAGVKRLKSRRRLPDALDSFQTCVYLQIRKYTFSHETGTKFRNLVNTEPVYR